MMDDVDEFLAHHGVKGMHWGSHRTQDIHDARIRQAGRMSEIDRHVGGALNSKSESEKQKHLSEIRRIAKEGLDSGDADKAGRSTRGEKLLEAGIGGSVGAVRTRNAVGTVGLGGVSLGAAEAVRAAHRHHEKDLLDKYSKLHGIDVQK
jgi:hypothetical protein